MTAAAIVAGGRAARMGGRPKGLLEVAGRRIVDRQLEVLREVLFSRVLLVANDPEPWRALGVAIIANRIGAGPLAGIDAALTALRSEEDAVVCVAGDMPLLAPVALRMLRDRAPHAMAVAARVGGRPEPLFARYGRACAPAVAAALAEGRLAAGALLESLGATFIDEAELRALDPALRFLENVNTPEDLARVEALVRAS